MSVRYSLIISAVLAIACISSAIDGVSVTAHWQGSTDINIGNCGTLWRHDIKNWVVTHTKIYDGCALCPRIDPRSGSQVAFIRDDGKICLMPITGGTITPIADGHQDGFIDWAGNWIYYIRGYAMTSASRTIRRVNVNTRADEQFVVLEGGVWRFQVSDDNTRMEIRASNQYPSSNIGTIFLYDMVVNDGQLEMNRFTGSGWHCQDALSPSGEYVIDGWDNHTGITVRRWSDIGAVLDLTWNTADGWGPGAAAEMGGHASRNTWSANSNDWLCVHMGWDEDVMGAAGNQVLVNYTAQQKLVITNNSPASGAYDDCGDFFLGMPTALKLPIKKASLGPVAVRMISQGFLTIAAPAETQWQATVTGLSGKRMVQTYGQADDKISTAMLGTGVFSVHVADRISGKTLASALIRQ